MGPRGVGVLLARQVRSSEGWSTLPSPGSAQQHMAQTPEMVVWYPELSGSAVPPVHPRLVLRFL